MKKRIATFGIVCTSFLFAVQSVSFATEEESTGDLALKQIEEIEEFLSVVENEFSLEQENKENRKNSLSWAIKNSKSSKITNPDHYFYLKKQTNLTAQELNYGLKNTALEGLGEAFKEAEDAYGVNSLFLIGLANHESNYGKSRIAQDKNNLFGFNANDSDPYNLASGYSSKKECILKVAEKINSLYLKEGARYNRGVNLPGMNKNYSSDGAWADKTHGHMKKVAEKILYNWE